MSRTRALEQLTALGQASGDYEGNPRRMAMSQTKPVSTMASAFTAAGWKPPSERLMARAVEAWGKYPNAGDGASRRSYVAEILANDMTWLLMQGHNPPALTAALENLLRHAADAIAAQRPDAGRGVRVVSGGGGGHAGGDTQPHRAAVHPIPGDGGQQAIAEPTPMAKAPAATNAGDEPARRAIETSTPMTVPPDALTPEAARAA